MSHTKDEREDGMFTEEIIESPPLIDDGGAGGGAVLKKGPWTSYEDAILIDYVRKHGEGNWNAIQKHCGLLRCGKSCRLRWANHLRPNLKKGAFTQEEEQLIIELHEKMGNKWARMAAHLPGRTDNEIKNYWNTRIKRHQRTGLPLYPPRVGLQAPEDSHCSSAINGGGKGPHDNLKNNSYKIPDIVFNSLKANQCAPSYVPGIPDMSARSMLTKVSGSPQCSSFMAPISHRHKRPRESAILFPGYNDAVKNECPLFQQFQGDMSNNAARSFSSASAGSHALSNGDFYASEPTSKAMKLQLPSLQSPGIELGNWGTLSCPPPLLENVDAFFQSQPPTSGFESDSLSPYNSGLLDALLHESKTLSKAAKHASDKSLNSSNPSDIAESSCLNIRETEWKNHGESRSPICHSTTSHFDESINASANSSLGEKPLAGTFPESDVKSKPVDHVLTSEMQKEAPIWMDGDRPDTLLGPYWLEQGSGYDKDQSIMTDATATLLGDVSNNEYKNMGAAASISSQTWGVGSCAWNDMPTLCQMSDLPPDLLPQL